MRQNLVKDRIDHDVDAHNEGCEPEALAPLLSLLDERDLLLSSSLGRSSLIRPIDIAGCPIILIQLADITYLNWSCRDLGHHVH